MSVTPPPSAAAPAGRGAASPSYLDHARDGRGSWLTYSLGLVLIGFGWLFLGGLLALVVAAAVAPGTAPDALGTLSGTSGLVVALVGFVPFLLATPLVVRYVLGRPWLTVVTAARGIDWGRVLQGAGWWTLLIAIGTGIDAVVHRGSYTFAFDLGAYLPYAVAALLLIPLQTTAEELLFRGYLVQWLSLRTRRIVVLSVADGLLFAVPHLANPEAAGAQWYAWLIWWMYGAGWTWVSVRDGSIELAVGAHAANNLFGTLVVGYSAGALPVLSIWTTSVLDLPLSIAVIAVTMPVFVLVTRRRTPAAPAVQAP